MAFDNGCTCTEQITECRCGVSKTIVENCIIILNIKYF